MGEKENTNKKNNNKNPKTRKQKQHNIPPSLTQFF